MPALETVAGVAVLRWLISNTNLMVRFKGMRSLLARVRTWGTAGGNIIPTESQSQEKLLGGLAQPFVSLSHPGLWAPHPWTSARTTWAGLDLCTTKLHQQITFAGRSCMLLMSSPSCILWDTLYRAAHWPQDPGPQRPPLDSGSRGSCGAQQFAYLVVIHDSVERLDPHGVDVPIQHDPLGAIVSDVGQVPHDRGEEACREPVGPHVAMSEGLSCTPGAPGFAWGPKLDLTLALLAFL